MRELSLEFMSTPREVVIGKPYDLFGSATESFKVAVGAGL